MDPDHRPPARDSRGAAMRIVKGSWRGGLALIAIALLTLVPGLWTIPVIDRDEARFAQASRQMFEAAAWPAEKHDLRLTENGTPKGAHSGGWSIPMVQDRPRLNKPPLVYWLQVGSAWVFTGGEPLRDAIWMYRVPGAVCALLSILLTWRLGLLLFDARAAWLGAAFMAVCPLIAFDAHQARADELLLTTVLAGQLCLWRIWRASTDHPTSWLWPLAFWVSIAASIMAKGPIGPLVVGLTALALSVWSGQWRWLGRTRPLIGVAIIAIAVGPWVWAVGGKMGWQTYAKLIYDETLGRARGSREGHWGPPGMHALMAIGLFWPGCLLTAKSIARGWRLGAPRRESGAGRRSVLRWLVGLVARAQGRPAEFFLIAWLVPGWIFFELFGAKLAHYPMPMYPALALLTARGVVAAETGGLGDLASRGAKFGVWVWNGVGVVLGCAVVFAAVMFAPKGDAITVEMVEAIMSLVGGLAVIALVAQASARATRGRWAGATRLGLAAGAVFIGAFMVYPARRILPTTGVLTAQVARTVQEELAQSQRLWGSNVVRDSAVFQTRGAIVQVMPEAAMDWLTGGPDRVYVHELDRGEEPSEFSLAAGGPNAKTQMLYRALVGSPVGGRAVVYFIRSAPAQAPFPTRVAPPKGP